ncbi:MAG: competence protein ComEA [Gammaproteobacteria bacterium]|nr:ComEA family DNA-binding protein [bacterium AH-315-E07]PCH60590.1 MAG: competence protein ComEA [Gammaproteobacteria bacterium]
MRLYALLCLFFLSTSLVLAGPVNINHSNADELETELVGIGPDKATAIIQYRQDHGPFTSVDDLVNVKGVGQKTIDKNRENLTVAE